MCYTQSGYNQCTATPPRLSCGALPSHDVRLPKHAKMWPRVCSGTAGGNGNVKCAVAIAYNSPPSDAPRSVGPIDRCSKPRIGNGPLIKKRSAIYVAHGARGLRVRREQGDGVDVEVLVAVEAKASVEAAAAVVAVVVVAVDEEEAEDERGAVVYGSTTELACIIDLSVGPRGSSTPPFMHKLIACHT
jgi:hypothetical protein